MAQGDISIIWRGRRPYQMNRGNLWSKENICISFFSVFCVFVSSVFLLSV